MRDEQKVMLILVAVTVAVILVILQQQHRGYLSASRDPAPIANPSRLSDSLVFADTPMTAAKSVSVRHDPIRVKVYYLFDVSRSFNPGTSFADSPLRRSIGTLPKVIQAFVDSLPLPQEHLVGTIAAASFRQRPLCDILIPRRTLFLRPDTLATSDSLRNCRTRLEAVAPSQYTDINGALKFASLALEGSSGLGRMIVIFSDLKTDIPTTQKPATADLTNLCLAIFYEPTEDDAESPDLFDQRRAEWKARLKGWHARDIQIRLLAAFTDSDIQMFAKHCVDVKE